MPYQDFRQFLDVLRQQGELIDVDRPIALTDVGKALKQAYQKGRPALSFTDNGSNGNLESMKCVNLVSKAAGTVKNVSASVAMTHSYVGDLVFKLKSPSGTVVTLMSRPGAAETLDNGADSPSGDDSNLKPRSPVTFEQGAATSAESLGANAGYLTVGTSSIACGDTFMCTYAPARGAAAAL